MIQVVLKLNIIPIRPVQLPTRRDRLATGHDVDGVVMELSYLAGIQAGVHYLNLQRVYAAGLRRMFPLLKKHIDLTKCSDAGLQALRLVLGHKLADVDGGYFLTSHLACLSSMVSWQPSFSMKFFSTSGSC